jgi:hypothetical protein
VKDARDELVQSKQITNRTPHASLGFFLLSLPADLAAETKVSCGREKKIRKMAKKMLSSLIEPISPIDSAPSK